MSETKETPEVGSNVIVRKPINNHIVHKHGQDGTTDYVTSFLALRLEMNEAARLGNQEEIARLKPLYVEELQKARPNDYMDILRQLPY